VVITSLWVTVGFLSLTTVLPLFLAVMGKQNHEQKTSDTNTSERRQNSEVLAFMPYYHIGRGKYN